MIGSARRPTSDSDSLGETIRSAEVKLPAALDVNSKQTVTEHQAESTLQHAADAAVCTLHCASICLVHSLHSLRSISHGDRQLSKFIHLIAGYFSIRH